MCKRTSLNDCFWQDRLLFLDPKSVVESSGSIVSAYGAKAFCCISSLLSSFGFTKSFSMLLQGSDMEICCTYQMITGSI